MNAYKILTGKFGRVEGNEHLIYGAGDVVRDLDPATVARLSAKGMIEAVSVAVLKTDDRVGVKAAAVTLLDGHWRAVVKAIEGIEDVERLQALLAEENARESPRRAVLKSLTERLAELE